MEKPESLAPVSGLNGESPGGVSRAVPGGVRSIETETGQPSGVALFRGSGPFMHPGGTVVLSPGSGRPSEGVTALSSGRSPHVGEVAGYSPGSGKSPGGFNSPSPGTSVPTASIPGPGEPQMYSSGSTCLHPHNYEDRPRSILKNSSSVLMKKTPSTEKKSQHWDEMNILATYHPANKDYGFLKVDEPGTPYHRLQNSDEDPSAGSSLKVTPESLAERFATMDNFLPKVLQYGDNRSSRDKDNFTKTYPSEFDKHRKTHYSEGKFLKAQKNQPLASEEDSNSASTSISSSTQDSSTCRTQFPSTSDTIMLEKLESKRKEYYTKGRYLRSCSHPELQEDIGDEQ